jgi:hypothetical protein
MVGMKTLERILIVVFFAAIAATAVLVGRWQFAAHVDAVPTLVAPAGSQTPTAQFLADYDEFLSLSKDVAKRQDAMQHASSYKAMLDEQDRANGMAQRLTSQVPKGYTFDAHYRAFVLPPATPAVAPIPDAPTAPQAKATPAH